MKQKFNQTTTSVTTLEGLSLALPIVMLVGLMKAIIMAIRKIIRTIENPFQAGLNTYGKMSDMKKIADGVAKPKKSIFPFLIRQWQFWVILAVLVLAFVFVMINGSSPADDVNHEVQSEVQPAQEVNVQSPADVSGVFTTIASGIGSWLSLIVLLIVLGTIVGVFVSLSNLFK